MAEKRVEVRCQAVVMATDPISEDRRLLLIKRNVGSNGEGLWTPPGGNLEETDSDPIALAEREFLEETGLPVHVVSLIAIHSIPLNEDGRGRRLGFVFGATVTEITKTPTVEHHHFCEHELQDLLSKEKRGEKVLFRPELNVENIQRWLNRKRFDLGMFVRKEP